MRLVRFKLANETRLGALIEQDGHVVDLQASASALLERLGDPNATREAAIRISNDVTRLLRGGARSRSLAEEALNFALANRASDGQENIIPRGQVRLEAPILPSLIVCGGGNFWDHLKELGREKPESVEFFLKNPNSTLGPDDDIPYLSCPSKKLDYEAELGIIIGKRGRCIPRDQALEHVFGYTAVNDMAVRDRQLFRWNDSSYFHVKYGDGKVFDGNIVLGPAIMTSDEIPDPMNLSLRCWVDGEARQNSNTSQYIWGIAEVIEYYSRMITLEPGFLICPGTPGGCAVGHDPECGGRWPGQASGHGYLMPGQTVTVEVERLGRIENRVSAAWNAGRT